MAAGYVAPLSLPVSMAVQRSQCQVAAPESCPAGASGPRCRAAGRGAAGREAAPTCGDRARAGVREGPAACTPSTSRACLHPGGPASLWDRVARGCVQRETTWGPRGRSRRRTAPRGPLPSPPLKTGRTAIRAGDELGHWAAAAGACVSGPGGGRRGLGIQPLQDRQPGRRDLPPPGHGRPQGPPSSPRTPSS